MAAGRRWKLRRRFPFHPCLHLPAPLSSPCSPGRVFGRQAGWHRTKTMDESRGSIVFCRRKSRRGINDHARTLANLGGGEGTPYAHIDDIISAIQVRPRNQVAYQRNWEHYKVRETIGRARSPVALHNGHKHVHMKASHTHTRVTRPTVTQCIGHRYVHMKSPDTHG